MSTGLVWFRSDLRLGDNPAWAAATAAHRQVTALFVVDPVLWTGAGPHRRAQLAAHLGALDRALAAEGGRLHVRRGDPRGLVSDVARSAGAEAVYWNAGVGPYAQKRDAAVALRLRGRGRTFAGGFVQAPGRVLTAAGRPFRIFTPYYRAWLDSPWETWPSRGSASVGDDAGEGIPVEGSPSMEAGEAGALGRLESFLERVDLYAESRDRPDLEGTSRLSADLHFGVISPRLVVRRVEGPGPGRGEFVRQLAWRDFHAQLLASFPGAKAAPQRPGSEPRAWRDDPGGFAAWAAGRTGYPFVDAGMRQLRREGWINNRVRMVAASFLVKDLLIDWRQGERYFRHWLVDGDPAQNIGNWQWVAGTGTDAAPYFRVFNPVAQSRRFDPEGVYLRRWVPELAGLSAAAIHSPWTAAPSVLARAGVVLGDTYPAPLVDHAEAREAALAAYAAGRAPRPGSVSRR